MVHQGGFSFSLRGPLNAVPVQRQMRAANISGFCHLVRNLGGDPRRILERHDIDPLAVEDPDHFIDRAAVVSALEYCSSLFDDRLFGLRLADLEEPDVFGCVTALARAAPQVRAGLQCFIDYLPVVHSAEGELELVRKGDLAELRWCAPPDFELGDQAIYQALLLSRKNLEMLVGRNFRPSYVSLVVNMRSKDAQAIEEKVRCRVQRRNAVNAMGNPVAYAIGFPVGVLDWPISTSDKVTFSLLGGYLERMKAASRATFVEQVEAFVRGAISSGHCTTTRCAKKLGISVRTLQWPLAESGVNFSDILQRQRIELARECLAREHFKLEQIATVLGYSEQASFGRAFKRWTGLTPRAFRSAER